MKLKVLTLALLASGAVATAATAAVKPGQWQIAGGQQICLQSAGTWYSTTFSGWGGEWALVGNEDKAIIFGNYASGVGNDSMIVEKGYGTDWTEWRDDLSFTGYLDDASFVFVKKKCDPPAARAKLNVRKNPMN